MPTLYFKGRVLPATIRVNTNSLSPISWTGSKIVPDMVFTVGITDSLVEVECRIDSAKIGRDTVVSCGIRALQLARAVVDCLCFIEGVGLTVIIDEVVEPDGTLSKIVFKNDYLPSLCTAFGQVGAAKEDDFDSMYRLIIKEPPLFLALNDLIVAITVPDQIAVNCARSVEGLRKILAPDASDRNREWALMQASLNLDKSYLEYITKASVSPRHGDRTEIARDIKEDLLKRSWIVMNRFLEYRKRDSQPLSLVEFPILR